MRAEPIVPKQVELSLSQFNNQVRIENYADSVCIRAARDNLSSRQKLFFIRYFAAEGYIPAHYQWFGDPDAGCFSGLTWTVDNAWLAPADEAQRAALRQIARVLSCATLLWLALMSFAFLRARSFETPREPRERGLSFETRPHSLDH
jgi:hypothetical protein